MAVTNILKDGTVVADMSTVTVPTHIVKAVVEISERVHREKSNEKQNLKSN